MVVLVVVVLVVDAVVVDGPAVVDVVVDGPAEVEVPGPGGWPTVVLAAEARLVDGAPTDGAGGGAVAATVTAVPTAATVDDRVVGVTCWGPVVGTTPVAGRDVAGLRVDVGATA